MIKAIDTVYNGYKFRSRLEARWAVFFDALGIKYEYEPEGYDIDGTYYLPDFFLQFSSFEREFCKYNNPGYFIEIKPIEPNETEIFKLSSLEKYTRHHSRFFIGIPGDHKVLASDGSLIIHESPSYEIYGNNNVHTLIVELHQVEPIDSRVSYVEAISKARKKRF